MIIYMLLIRAGLIRMFKGAACLGLVACSLVCFLLSYSYISGDRLDREDMHRTFANFTRKMSFVQTAQADFASEKSDELTPPKSIKNQKRTISSQR